ncbi:MAG: flagellar biosynthesis protein FlhB [Acidobacteria bacterium]|nr:flagellar biosynthesis protein FlhB [Acidobacteriota bacterium]
MAGGTDKKTEQPTRRKLKKAREKGQVARSREVPAAAVLMGVVLMLYYFGKDFFHTLQNEMYYLLNLRVPQEISMSYLTTMVQGITVRTASVMVPILVGVLGISVFSNILQGGLAFSTHSLKLKPEKLNPKNGLKKIFSKNGLVELIKSLVVVSVVTLITYQVIVSHLSLYPRLVLMDQRKIIYWIASISFNVLIRIAILMVLVALFDFCFQKYRFREQMKMSKKEVKEEYKEMEGDPTTKGRIRRIQRAMARRRMMAEVPKADVIITNPTHYAIALSYKMDSMEAPKVIAKGVGFLAQKIKELAQQHGIPQVENKPLARALYKSVEIGEYIPAHLYRAVAEILAYIYKAKTVLHR